MPRLTAPQVAPIVQDQPVASPSQMPGAGLVQGIERLSAQVGQMAEQARRRGLEIRRNELEVQARRLANRILSDPQSGVLNRQRQAAFDADQVALDQWRQGVDAMLTDVRDPELRQAVELMALDIGSRIEEQALRHVRKQMDVVDAEQTEALQGELVQEIVGNAPSETRTAEAIARLTDLTKTRLARQDVTDPMVVDAEVKRVRSGARLAQVTALADTDPDRARAVVERYGDELVGKDKADAERIVKQGTLTVQRQRATDTLVAEFGDEAEALRAARERYTGELRDAVVRDVKVRFDEQAQAKRQRVEAVANEALASIVQTNRIPRNAEVFLLRESPETLLNLQRYIENRVEGDGEPETKYKVWQEISEFTDEDWKNADPMKYLPYLTDAMFREFLDERSKRLGTGRRTVQDKGLTPTQITQELLNNAIGMGLIPERTNTLAKLDDYPTDYRKFSNLRTAVMQEIDRRRTENNNRPLGAFEMREAMRAVLDDQVIEGRLFKSQRPRAFSTEPVQGPPQTVLPPMRPGMTRADRWEELVNAGTPEAEATRIVNEEMPR